MSTNNKNFLTSIVIVCLVVIAGYFILSKKVNDRTSLNNTGEILEGNSNVNSGDLGTQTTFENQYIKINIPEGWRVLESSKKSGGKVVKTGSVSFIKGKYILYINPNSHQASGVEGGRFAEIAMGAPSADAVVTYQPSEPCGKVYPSGGPLGLMRADLWVGGNDKADWCNVPTNGKTVWYFSYLTNTDMNRYFNYYQGNENTGLVVTMSYNSKDINSFPEDGSEELSVVLTEMNNILGTLKLKQNSL